MGMLDIFFFFAKEMLFGCRRILRSSDFLRFISEQTCPKRESMVFAKEECAESKDLDAIPRFYR